MEITQEEYTKRLKNLDFKTKEAVLNIESNPAIFVLAETYDLDQETTYSICYHINLQILGFTKSADLIRYISENTVIDGNEFERIYPILLDNILKKSSHPLFKTEEETNSLSNFNRENTAGSSESNHISHIDVLNEIENPTPSISTTTAFQNQANTNKQTTSSTINTSQNNPSTTANVVPPNSSTTNPSLHSSDPSVIPYSNPALHIATKLDQNLSSPSASIPKDIYVSKRPDPYHEPVEM